MYLVVGRSLEISSFVSAVKKDVLGNKKDFYQGEKKATYCKNSGGGRGGQRNRIRARLLPVLRSSEALT